MLNIISCSVQGCNYHFSLSQSVSLTPDEREPRSPSLPCTNRALKPAPPGCSWSTICYSICVSVLAISTRHVICLGSWSGFSVSFLRFPDNVMSLLLCVLPPPARESRYTSCHISAFAFETLVINYHGTHSRNPWPHWSLTPSVYSY